MPRGVGELCSTQVRSEKTGISTAERKRVREVEQKVTGPPPAGRHKPMLGSALAVDEDEQCSALWSPLDRGCGEKCWRAGVEKPKHLQTRISRAYRGRDALTVR